jgi:hypothetical protein
MLISKKSRRQSEVFASRFRDGAGAEFPVRRYLRCREDFASGLVHLVLLTAFLVTLAGFGRTIDRLFTAHGDDLSPWFRRGAFLLLGVICLSVLRRIYYKVAALKELRGEMKSLKATFRAKGE